MDGVAGRWWAQARNEMACNGACHLFLAILAVQVLHFLEHAIQVHQILLNGLAGAHHPTRGLLGDWFDFVGVHLAYNLAVLGVLVAVFLMWRRNPAGWRTGAKRDALFQALLAFQGYHAAEHVVQAWQYWFGGVKAAGGQPPGLIGQVVPNPIAHFDLNLVLTLGMLAVWVFLRPRRMRVATRGRAAGRAVPA